MLGSDLWFSEGQSCRLGLEFRFGICGLTEDGEVSMDESDQRSVDLVRPDSQEEDWA